MLFHVHMTVNLPHDMPEDKRTDLLTREKAYAQDLQRQGVWRHLWRIVGKYENISIFDVESSTQLHDYLSALPLFPYMDITVSALCPHPSAINTSTNAGETLMSPDHLSTLIEKITSSSEGKVANPRVAEVVGRIIKDLFQTIEDLDVTPEEFWSALDYLRDVGQNNEFGLLAPGLGFEHFLDLRMDEAEAKAGIEGGTPRTIEGPLYVPNAPLSKGEARLDDGSDEGDVVFMSGRVLTTDGTPVANAIVDVWHANTRGLYSIFDTSQTPFNLRRRIETGPDGRYTFRSIIPSGYACPPEGPTQKLLDLLGRHGNRPAHIHFLVKAPGYRTLTTQINLDGDEYLHDDFAFATRDELVASRVRKDDPAEISSRGLQAPFYTIDFDFTLNSSSEAVSFDQVDRSRVEAPAEGAVA